ncbi:hypothetical protein H5904_25655 [Klebsiella pneumoniae]|uniref:hypothetical protein n=1 Tax=Klebsiella pneumoniae TaxID=573 RepID=UPI0014172BB0|nr:hypothetical protein [Klebsiella pneumoniae]MBC4987386.1 hypothetical protein [Klebsiella pneumoniae]MCB2984211.1 hypothetical protein [Klebsiella pneumoniae]MCB3061301.1 hypothetical protein [Klebsiella pneumoniae]QIQ36651.1 hypothetical protein E8Q43_07080 [Klebsiella pneumoniae subsp. pneumoniae]HBT1581033.1 hypothetical protein [Klebsiella pneumoniae]
MKERGMIFNGEMVRAILDGRKTQTRRPIKWKQTRFTEIGEREDDSKWPWSEDAEHACDFWHPCPFGAVGDRIWVRETWSDVNLDGAPAVAYRADDEVYDLMENESLLDEDGAFNYQDTRVSKYQFAAWHSDLISGIEGNWRPSIHMPRWASRILLEITNVRVERLNSMHDVDAMREGIQNLTTCSHSDFGIPGVVNAQHPVRAFQLLWESIYGTDSWHANPWVWVIEFKRVEGGAA